jgi:hypothetical protein
VREWASGFLLALGLMLYDEILTAGIYHYCYPFPLLGCYGAYQASYAAWVLILASFLLLVRKVSPR